VGKATSLKNRVSSYFKGARTSRPIEQMLHEVADIKWKITDSVLEAVILEAVYIKKYQPKYNVLGKDNKSWNYITISNDAYPLVQTIRQHEWEQHTDTHKLYTHVFGPYPGLNTRETMKILRRIFFISDCQKTNTRTRGVVSERKITKELKSKIYKPCFYYQIGQCLGVCIGEITARDYIIKVIKPLMLFLEGKKQTVIKNITVAMKTASKNQDFEEAARLRNQLHALDKIQDVALINKDFFSFDFVQNTTKQSIVNGNIRIEGYDISNLGATGKVGSMVVFNKMGPLKSQYRKFKIRTVIGQSDVDSMEEMIRRRVHHPEWPFPTLFLIDGGAPQVNRVVKILQELKISIPVVGIAKGPERKRNDFYLGTKTKPVVQWVSQNQSLLIKVRDEAHRFAITYQRSLRKLK
jgi:excinuclease ABC subunit C